MHVSGLDTAQLNKNEHSAAKLIYLVHIQRERERERERD